jgi:hypothetical protein
MTPRQRIDKAESALWADIFGEPLEQFCAYSPKAHGLIHSLLWDCCNLRWMKRGYKWVDEPTPGWRHHLPPPSSELPRR